MTPEERLKLFVYRLATNPHKPATWMQTRAAAADLLRAVYGPGVLSEMRESELREGGGRQ